MGVAVDKVHDFGDEAEGGGEGGRWGVGEVVEGDGRVRGGDALDVSIYGGVVREAIGKEDDDGVMVSLEKKHGKFNHGNNVASPWGRIQH